jgi:hypothetical protein
MLCQRAADRKYPSALPLRAWSAPSPGVGRSSTTSANAFFSDLCRATRGAKYSSFPVPNSNSLSRPFQGRFEHFFLEGKGLNDRSDDLVVPDLRGKGR